MQTFLKKIFFFKRNPTFLDISIQSHVVCVGFYQVCMFWMTLTQWEIVAWAASLHLKSIGHRANTAMKVKIL